MRPLLLPALALTLVVPSTSHGRPAWSHETLGAVWSAPLTGRDGRIYVGSEDGFFYAFEPGGRLRWVYKASDGFSGWPVWVRRGLLAVGNRNGTVYLFNEQGDVKLKVAVDGAPLGPPAVEHGQVFQGTTAGKLVALGPGGVKWIHDTGSAVTAYPAVSRGRLFVGCSDGTVIALDARGAQQWRVRLPGGNAVHGAVVAGADRVTLATTDGVVFALSARDGTTIWRRRLSSQRGGVAALPAGGVVLGTLKGELMALDSRGEVTGRFAADGPIHGTPTVSGGRILFGTDRGTLYWLGLDGSPHGLYTAGGSIKGGITLDGRRALFGSTDRRIYAFPLQGGGRWQHARQLKRRLVAAPRGRQVWRRDLSGPVACGVGPGTDGRLLAGTWGNRMFVLRADGRVQWSYNCGADVDTLPAMDATGAAVFGCNDGGFYGLKPDGDLRFRLPVNKALASSPAVTRDGTVYFGARDRRIYSLDRKGKVRWRIRTGGDVDGAPRIDSDGVVYIGSDDRHLYAVDPLGHIAWYHKLPGAVRSRPAIGKKGTLLVTAMDQRLHAITADGQDLWDLQTEGQIVSWPVVDKDGTTYFGSRDHRVYAVNADGKLRWSFETADEVDSHPALSADGKSLLVGSDDGNLYAVNAANGALRWWYPARAAVRGSLVTRDDGTTVLGTMDGAVIAVAPPGEPASRPKTPEATGQPMERFLVGQGRYGPPVMMDDGTLVVAGVDGMVRAFGPDRWPLWTVRVGNDRLSRPVLAREPGQPAAVFVTDARGNLACVANGLLRFRLRLDREPLGPPAVVDTADGPLVTAGTRSGRLWAVTPTGKVRWFHSGEHPVVRAALGLGRAILVPAGSEVTGLDPSGHRRWAVRMPAGITAGPVAISKTRALVGDGLGHLWAVSAAGAVVWKQDMGAGVRRVRMVQGELFATVLTAHGRVVEVASGGRVLLQRAPSPPPVEIVPTAGDVTYLVGADGTLLALDRRTGAVSRALELSSHETSASAVAGGGAVLVTDDGWATMVPARREGEE